MRLRKGVHEFYKIDSNSLKAQPAASRTNALSSSTKARKGATIAASPLFPAAIATLRTKRSRPVRLIGEPENSVRKAASSSVSRSAMRGAVSSAFGKKALLAAALCANLFHGQADRQSSQP